VEKEGERKSLSWMSLLARYFVHGISFSALLALSLIAWSFVAAFLIITGFVIGLILAFVVLFIIIGGLNILLTEFIWKVPIKQDWKRILAHGFLLPIVLILTGIPSIIIRLVAPSWVTTVVLFIVYCFIDGFVAKEVAFIWRTSGGQYDSGLSTVLKYPALIGFLMADALIVIPLFVVSLATSYWWLGSILFSLAQSPVAYLVFLEIKHEASRVAQPKDGWWVPLGPQKLGIVATEGREEENGLPWRPVVAKFFLHGIAFSVLLLILVIVWAFLVAFLVFTGFIIGLILGLIIFLFIEGGLNILLTEYIWHVSIKQDWKGILGHGLLLSVVLGLAGIPSLIINLDVPSWITATALFVVYCFVDGFLARRVALVWERQTSYDSLSQFRY
jgi:hypothetical protein